MEIAHPAPANNSAITTTHRQVAADANRLARFLLIAALKHRAPDAPWLRAPLLVFLDFNPQAVRSMLAYVVAFLAIETVPSETRTELANAAYRLVTHLPVIDRDHAAIHAHLPRINPASIRTLLERSPSR